MKESIHNSCTDCEHYIVCSMANQQMWQHEEACKDFVKEGSRFTLDELKGWLSEVAENNYGNALEYSCNELIRRINEGGFERYVTDTRYAHEAQNPCDTCKNVGDCEPCERMREGDP